jgi:hypothetical protein
MSYSFSVRGTNADALVSEVEKQFDGIVAGQAIHAKDRAAVVGAVRDLAEIIDLETGKDLRASVTGSIYWTEGDVVRSVNAQISLSQDTAAAPA